MRRPVAEVFVRLKRDADQRRNGIRQLFGELVCLIRVRFHVGSIGGVEPSNRQKKSGEDDAQSAGRRIVLYIHAIRLGVVLNWRRQLSRARVDWRTLALSVTAFNSFPSPRRRSHQKPSRILTGIQSPCIGFNGPNPSNTSTSTCLGPAVSPDHTGDPCSICCCCCC